MLRNLRNCQGEQYHYSTYIQVRRAWSNTGLDFQRKKKRIISPKKTVDTMISEWEYNNLIMLPVVFGSGEFSPPLFAFNDRISCRNIIWNDVFITETALCKLPTIAVFTTRSEIGIVETVIFNDEVDKFVREPAPLIVVGQKCLLMYTYMYHLMWWIKPISIDQAFKESWFEENNYLSFTEPYVRKDKITWLGWTCKFQKWVKNCFWRLCFYSKRIRK